MLKKSLFILFVLFYSFCFYGQESVKQNVRGVVKDNITGQPLKNINIKIFNDNFETGTTTDSLGLFLIKNIPVGYYSIYFSSVGYESKFIQRTRLVSSRELYLEVNMDVSVETLDETVIFSSVRKDQPNNPRALVSSRSFTLDEANKYAGSYGDPSRMAINYAGVLPARDNRNDIIIRGNTSNGLLWKLDGMEIPNPNHFGATGSTGGPITIINNNLLMTSDFHTGAFPAQFSNATSGVFDLNMKSGNPDNYNNWVQLGWNGLELGSEGPVPGDNKITYATAYRYSFVDILAKMGLTLPEKVSYQDFSLKTNIPGTSLGNFAITAIGGKSSIELLDSDKPTDQWLFENNGEDVSNSYKMGAIGLSHNKQIGDNSVLNSNLYATGNRVENVIDTFSIENPQPFLWAHEKSEEIRTSLSTVFRHRYSSNSDFSFGVYIDNFNTNFVDSQFVKGNYRNVINSIDRQMLLLRSYSDVYYRLSNDFRTYFGVNFLHFDFTGENIIEPRLGLKWDISDKNSLSYGSGLHSQMQPRMMYFVMTEVDGDQHYTNKNLKFTKSFHNVIGYDHLISDDLRLKLEAYYQYIYDAPVSYSEPAYSLLNYGAEFYVERMDSLVNEGEGRNYGIEATLEKFWSDKYFFLITGSLFDSKYTGKDGVERNTAFNGRFAVNMLGGYEFVMPGGKRSMNIGLNLTYAGGRPYVPYDIESSLDNREVKLLWENAYSVQRNNYKRASIRIGFKHNFERFNVESAIDLQYRTDYTSIYFDRLDLQTGEIIKTYSMGFYPMANVRIEF